MRINVVCHDTNFEPIPIVGLHWYNGVNGNSIDQCPNLAITFENGKTQLMKNENDTSKQINSFYKKYLFLFMIK